MRVNQALEFNQTVARFLAKRKAIEMDETLSEKAKYELLKQLSSKETMAIGDILESYCSQEYMQIEDIIQLIEKPSAKDEELIVVNFRDHYF